MPVDDYGFVPMTHVVKDFTGCWNSSVSMRAWWFYFWQFSYLLWDFGQYLCISVSACSNSVIESLGIKHCWWYKEMERPGKSNLFVIVPWGPCWSPDVSCLLMDSSFSADFLFVSLSMSGCWSSSLLSNQTNLEHSASLRFQSCHQVMFCHARNDLTWGI